jgi:hypothetical protein
MRRKWLRTALWVLLTPIILFIILMILLYVPPVQNLIRKQATAIASGATGMDISVERIDLRFPLNLLVRGVLVVQPADSAVDVQHPDTLLNLGSLNVRVQAWPLLKGKVEVDDITLKQVAVNSSNLMEGMCIKGVLGHFFFESHGIDLTKEDAILNNIELSDTHVQVMLADTTETPKDTTDTALNWKVTLHTLKLKNVSVDLQMPLDSMGLKAHIGDAEIADAAADLKHQFYGWRKFLLTGTSVNYDTGGPGSAIGFDPSHIALRDIRLGIDSVMYYGRDMNAVIREFSMYERSGLSVTSLTGRLFADSTVIRIPSLKLLTPHSEMNLTAQTYWELINIPTTGRLTARFNARIGKQDVLLFAGGLPEAFKEAYPFRPLVIHAGTEGNLKQMQISRFTAELPGAFSLSGGGEFWSLTDSVKRNGSMDFEMHTQNLNFLTGLADIAPDGSISSTSSFSTAFCKRSALRRVSATKLSRMDFAASGSSTEKAVSEKNLYPGQAEVSETSITSIPLSSIFNSCSNSLTVNGLCRHPANPCTVNSSRCMSLRAVTAITGTDCACGMFEARSSFSKSKPLIAGICTSVSRTSKVAVRKASSSSSSCKQETEFIPLC